jgi:hypothetical protein
VIISNWLLLKVETVQAELFLGVERKNIDYGSVDFDLLYAIILPKPNLS